MNSDRYAVRKESRGVQGGEHRRAAIRAIAWDDLQIVLAVSDAGSFRSAATLQRVSVNTVRKRIERVEHLYGQSLFRRTAAGVVATAAGEALILHATQMRSAGTAHLSPDENLLMSPGELRIGCSDSIGFLWLTPRVSDLQKGLEGLTVFLQCDHDVARDRTREVDVTLQLFPNRAAGIVCDRIATLHYMFYASRDYLERHGTPGTLDQLRSFQMLEQVAPGVRSDVLDALIGSDRAPDFVPLRTNSSLVLLWATANGAGIAGLPTFVQEITDRLVPIDLPAAFRRELYVAYHRDARESPAIKQTLKWLRAAFDSEVYPWFGCTFVHPKAARRTEPRSARWFGALAAQST